MASDVKYKRGELPRLTLASGFCSGISITLFHGSAFGDIEFFTRNMIRNGLVPTEDYTSFNTKDGYKIVAKTAIASDYIFKLWLSQSKARANTVSWTFSFDADDYYFVGLWEEALENYYDYFRPRKARNCFMLGGVEFTVFGKPKSGDILSFARGKTVFSERDLVTLDTGINQNIKTGGKLNQHFTITVTIDGGTLEAIRARVINDFPAQLDKDYFLDRTALTAGYCLINHVLSKHLNFFDIQDDYAVTVPDYSARATEEKAEIDYKGQAIAAIDRYFYKGRPTFKEAIGLMEYTLDKAHSWDYNNHKELD